MKPSTRDADGGACNFEIAIEAHGDVNIHHHCPPPAECRPDGGGSNADCYPPIAPGSTCLPPVAGRKHKRSPRQKLEALASRARVPSVLAASTMQLLRRHLAGKTAANALEQTAFARLNGLPGPVRSTLRCALDRFDALPTGLRSQLFDSTVGQSVDQPVDPAILSKAAGLEFAKRASLVSYGDADAADEERPGRIRVFEPGVEDFFSQVRICSVNTLRTQDFIPAISPGGLRPEEIAQDCQTTIVNGVPQVSCQVRTGNCVGGSTAGVCLTVPAVAAGDGVVLQGVNFFSLDARVRLSGRAPSTTVVDVDAHVFGDLETAVVETVGDQQRLVNDCRVHDRIGFAVPSDLPPAIYDVNVIVPNITGIDGFPPEIFSNTVPLEVTPPLTARFQITGERLFCKEETSPGWLGSDEVGLRTMAIPLLADLSVGELQTTSRRFGDVDSDESRDISRIFFNQTQPILAVAMSVLGHEVDGEDAYENLVTKSTDIFIDLVKEQAAFIKDALAAAGIGLKDIAKLGTTGAIVIGIAIAVVLVIDLIVSLWAPADLIVEDPTGYTVLQLTELTGADFPMPGPTTFTTEGDIDVTVTPEQKVPTQYRERRRYKSSDEDSTYEVVYRFNRTA